MRISIIVPFRASADRPYLLERLRHMSILHAHADEAEWILVDSGSDPALRVTIEQICESAGIRYLYHDSHGDIFAIGAARDFGVQHALGEWVTFLDVDLIPVPDFAKKMCEVAEITGANENPTKFFVVPCLYLTEEGTEKFLALPEASRHRVFFQKYLDGDKADVQNLAPCSSVMMVNRRHYLSIGGHRPEFKGHGYEDFELIHRLCAEEAILPRPRNYYHDSKTWQNTTYQGFRSYFALKGRAPLYHGLFVVHLWHPRPPSDGYEAHRTKNHANADAFFRQFDKDKLHPPPLLDMTFRRKRTLFFGTPGASSMECIRGAIPYLGDMLCVNESVFLNESGDFDTKSFETFISYQKVDRILFPNSYGNAARKEIYAWAKSNGFPYLVFERGALPESWFFDPTGFNADSESYNPSKWDIELNAEAREKTIRYVDEVVRGNEALESQGNRIGAKALAWNLRTGGKKVLFVPFQRPSDTVITYFSGDAGSVEQFAMRIDAAAKKLEKYGWTVLCKKHPLENSTYELQHAKWVPPDTHFMDLIELADSVALINSGVGLYSIMLEKPTYVLGKAFYNHPALTTEVSGADDLSDLVIKGMTVCRETMLRLIKYLRSDFYSYGVPIVSIRNESDGSLRSVTSRISFYYLRIPSVISFESMRPAARKLSVNCPTFEPYSLDINQYEQAKKAAKSAAPAGAVKSVVAAVPSKTVLHASQSARLVERNRIKRKLRKLKNNPKAFFRDSSFPPFGLIGRLIA
jgi:predicted glycosyltransferase involved in capsule biosynthesis